MPERQEPWGAWQGGGPAPGERWKSEPTALIPALKTARHPSENDLINPFFCFQANSSHLSELFQWEKYLVFIVIN